MKCKHCGFELEDGARFCLTCGQPVEQERTAVPDESKETAIPEKPEKTSVPKEPEQAVIPEEPERDAAPEPEKTAAPEPKRCPRCGAAAYPGARFCAFCGGSLLSEAPAERASEPDKPGAQPGKPARSHKLTALFRKRERQATAEKSAPGTETVPPEPAVPENGAAEAPAPGDAPGNGKSHLLKLAVAGVVLLLAAVIALAGGLLLFRSKSSGGYLYYIDNGSLAALDLAHPDRAAVEYAAAHLSAGNYPLSSDMIRLSPDGKYIGYPADVNSSGAYKLYVQRLGSDKDPVRLTDSAVSYRLLGGGGAVYLDAGGSLYLADRKGESQRLDRDVVFFDLDKPGKTVIWLLGSREEGYDLMARPVSLREEKRRIARDFESWLATESWDCAVFLSDGALYVSRDLAEAEQADTQVTALRALFEDGTLYYSREPLDRTLDELIPDARLKEDLALLETVPQKSDYPAADGKGTDWDAYDDALERYETAYGRSGLREALADVPLRDLASSLWRMDLRSGEKGSQVAAAVTSAWKQDGGYLYCEALDFSRVTDLDALYLACQEAGQDLDEALYRTCGFTVYLTADGLGGWCLLPDGTGEQALYTYTAEAGPGAGRLLSDTVSRIAALDGGDIYYCLASRNDDGDLYRNGVLLAQDVFMYGPCAVTDGNVWFFTDWDSRSMTGTLCFFDGKKVRTVAEDVSESFLHVTEDGVWYASGLSDRRESFTLGCYRKKPVQAAEDVYAYVPLPGGKAAVLREYSARRGEGTLYWFDGKSLTALGQNVSMLFGAEGYGAEAVG